jgi:hypothetical protein
MVATATLGNDRCGGAARLERWPSVKREQARGEAARAQDTLGLGLESEERTLGKLYIGEGEGD